MKMQTPKNQVSNSKPKVPRNSPCILSFSLGLGIWNLELFPLQIQTVSV